MKIPMPILIASITIYGIAHCLGSGVPVLTVNATVTMTDGTVTELNDIHINGGSEFFVYAKPANIENKGTLEVRLTIKPGDQVGPFQLATVKTITFKNPRTMYLYQEEKTGIKHSFVDIEVDGRPFLIRKDWIIDGQDTRRIKHKLDPDSVQSIAINSACAKTEVPTEPAATCICPAPK